MLNGVLNFAIIALDSNLITECQYILFQITF